MLTRPIVTTTAALFLAAQTAHAQQAPADPPTKSPDKSAFHLFNPTPRDLRRPLVGDRPDATESPYTVDAGAFQIEASFAELGIETEQGDTATALSVAPINLRVGVTNDIDLHLLFTPWERTDQPGTDTVSGFGDFCIRAKFNLWGNDEGKTALALLPYAIFPTGEDSVTDNATEFGLIVPFAIELNDDWSLGTQAEISFQTGGDTQDTSELSHTVVLGRSIAGDLAGYIEYIGAYELQNEPEYRPALSAGLTYLLDPDTQLDAGVLIGLDNGDSEDLRIFAGITKRF